MPESEPNYLGPAFATLRQILIAAKGVSDEDAASLLLEAWRADRQRNEEHARQAGDEGPNDKVPKEVTWDDKKQVGDSIILPPCQYACDRLNNWEYVPLWYFCPEGRAEVTEDYGSSGSAGTKSSFALKQDHELTWREFDLARYNFLGNIRAFNWPKRYIDSLSNFFRNICTHNLRFRNNGEQILLLYASRVRREWHDSLERGEGFNIGIINEHLLDAILREVYNSFQDNIARQVSFSCLPRKTSTVLTRLDLSISHPSTSFFDICAPFYRIQWMDKLRDVPGGDHYPTHGHSHSPDRYPTHGRSRSPDRYPIHGRSRTPDRYSFRPMGRSRSPLPRRRRRSPSPQRLRKSPPRHFPCPHSKSQPFDRDFSRTPRSSSALPVCPLCLGRSPHRFRACHATSLWNNRFPTYCRRNLQGHYINPEKRRLCLNWQHSRGCSDSPPAHRGIHECSGCGDPSHGAYNCPRAEGDPSHTMSRVPSNGPSSVPGITAPQDNYPKSGPLRLPTQPGHQDP